MAHAALRALVRRIAHSYRMFLVVTTLACLGECFAASLYAVSVHGRHGDGDADVPSDVSSDVSSGLASSFAVGLRVRFPKEPPHDEEGEAGPRS